MTQSIGGFFSGGAKGVTWPAEPPASVSGTILEVYPPEETLDPKDQKPTGKMQVRILLQTDLRSSEIEDDDGRRTLYVKSWMRGAVGDALRKAGVKEPEVGGKLTVTFVRTEPPEGPGLSASKHFDAQYVPATPAAAGEFFNSSPGLSSVSNGAPAKPPSIDQRAWDAMDDSTKKAVAATMATLPSGADEPPF